MKNKNVIKNQRQKASDHVHQFFQKMLGWLAQRDQHLIQMIVAYSLLEHLLQILHKAEQTIDIKFPNLDGHWKIFIKNDKMFLLQCL